jgi:rhodanese-related sulfurtransferase
VKIAPPQISRDELALRLGEPNPPLVIDVLPEEEYEAAHLPGAKNACVFNVSFLDDVTKLALDRSRPLVLYGSSSRDLASATAVEKLLAAGRANPPPRHTLTSIAPAGRSSTARGSFTKSSANISSMTRSALR